MCWFLRNRRFLATLKFKQTWVWSFVLFEAVKVGRQVGGIGGVEGSEGCGQGTCFVAFYVKRVYFYFSLFIKRNFFVSLQIMLRDRF